MAKTAMPPLEALAAFARKAIVAGRKGEYKGIHTVYSGFNDAVRKHFDVDPIEATKQLVASGDFVSHFVRGGAMLYTKEEAPTRSSSGGDRLLAAMGLAEGGEKPAKSTSKKQSI